jgi:hypothetical protein
MMRISMIAIAMPALAMAQGFMFTIGSPVASQDFRLKAAAFAFRTGGCPDPAKPQVSAVAEGVVKTQRRSVTLRVVPGTKPGVYAVYQSWPAEGQWVVSLKGICANLTAGALIPIGPNGFIRDSAKFFPHAATDTEIETSLRTLGQGGNK